MRNHYERIVRDAEKRARQSLRRQVKQPGKSYGAFENENGVTEAKYAVYRATSALSVYCCRDSCFYHDPEIFAMIRDGLRYAASRQHESGLFDLVGCNFESAPDTAFILKRIHPFLMYLDAHRETKEEEEVFQLLREIAVKGANGVIHGGFHTPNHRWAIASCLLLYGQYFDDEAMKKRADDYLLEGIDCTEDGEFSEKSSGNYNRINNDAMIAIGYVKQDRQYFEYAVRNLRMMLTYIEPDGSIFTANSTRQDNGKLVYPKDYYMEYLEMGIVMDIPLFLDMANYIFELVDEKHLRAPDFLIHFLNHPEWIDLEHEGVWKPADFNRLYRDSGIARVRREDCTYTVMQNKTDFLHVSTKTMHLTMKIGAGYFEHRAFKAQTLEQLEEGAGYAMDQVMQGWYYLPFAEKPATSDWWKMDNASRDKLEGPQLWFAVRVEEKENGLDVRMKAEGVDGAPLRIEIAVSGADRVSGSQFDLKAEQGGSMILKDGAAAFSTEEETMEVGPGFCAHRLTVGNLGSDAQSPYAFTVYCTDYTEFDHTIQIRF